MRRVVIEESRRPDRRHPSSRARTLDRPASYFGLAQTDPVQGVVALEDLEARGIVFARATKPLTVELAALVGPDAMVVGIK